MSVIDLSTKKKVLNKYNILFNKISSNHIKSFSEIIDSVKSRNGSHFDWLISSTSSRNTLISDLYYNYCLIILIKNIIKNDKKIKKIILPSIEFKKTIEQFVNENMQIEFLDNNYLFKLFSKYINLYKIVIYQLIKRTFQLLICRITKKNINITEIKELILIDTFSIPGFYTKDRYYQGLVENIDKKNINKIYFLPTIAYTSFFRLKNVYDEIRKSKRKFIIKEDHVSLKDIFYSIFYCFRLFKIKITSKKKYNIDFSILIENDLKKLTGSNIAIEGFINYFFFKNISIKNFDIKLVINWWENQSIDRGLCYGVKNFFPNTSLVGYLGYVPRKNEIQLFPTKNEYKSNVIPNIISVIGKSVVKSIKTLNKNQKVNIAPAFRYQHLYNKNRKKLNKKILLVALPITFNDTNQILKQILSCDNYFKKNNINIILKFHPTMNTKKIKKKYINSAISKYKFTSDSIPSLLNRSFIVITSMSIVGLEAISKNIPVLIIRRNNSLDFNPIPETIPQKLWKECVNENDIIKYIKYFNNRNNFVIKQHHILSKKIKENYFCKLNKKNTMNFIYSKKIY